MLSTDVFGAQGGTVSTASTVRFTAGAGIFLFATEFRPALGPTQPPVQ